MNQKEWQTYYSQLTKYEQEQIAEEIKIRLALCSTNAAPSKPQIISWLATLSGLTLITGGIIFLTMPGAPLIPRLTIATIAGYLTALAVLSIRHFQDWQAELVIIKTKINLT